MSSRQTGRQMGLGSGRCVLETAKEGMLKSFLQGTPIGFSGSVKEATEEEGDAGWGAIAASSAIIDAAVLGEEWLSI